MCAPGTCLEDRDGVVAGLRPPMRLVEASLGVQSDTSPCRVGHSACDDRDRALRLCRHPCPHETTSRSEARACGGP